VIERYIRRDALGDLIASLFAEDGPFEEEWLLESEDSTRLSTELSSHLLDELWPEDDDVEGAEHLLASSRSCLLMSRMLAALADNPYYLRAEAARFAGLAERDARKLAALEKDDGLS
jgi:hypothetical protein